MFFASLKTVAGQVLMLYLISLIGFVTDKLGVFRQAVAKRVIDLLFNIVLPIAIIYTFMTMAYTPDHVRGILLAFVCAFATQLVGGVLGQLCFRHRSPMERGVYLCYTWVDENNAASRAALAKLGFVHRGEWTEGFLLDAAKD